MTLAASNVLERDINTDVVAENYGAVQLKHHAKALGIQLKLDEQPIGNSTRYLAEFEANVETIDAAYNIAGQWAKTDDEHSPLVNWLLDNYYVINEQVSDIRTHLPLRFLRQLPRVSNGQARIHVLAEELLLHCDCALDEQLIIRFANDFQTHAELTIGETWAFAVMLRLVLIEHLKYLCLQLERDYSAKLELDKILHDLQFNNRFGGAEIRKIENANSLIVISKALKERCESSDSWRVTFDNHLTSLGWNINELQKWEQHRLATCQVSMGNIITSMRLLKSIDWSYIFEEVNKTEKVLRRDPSHIYEQMDFESRNRYRDVVEQIARSCRKAESVVANQAISFAVRNAQGSNPTSTVEVKPDAHVGYWLIDEGLSETEAFFGFRPPLFVSFRRWLAKRAAAIYFGSIASIVALVLLPFTIEFAQTEARLLTLASLCILMLIPASEIALLVVNSFLTRILPVRLLPKIELKSGIPSGFPTFVVIPTMLTSPSETEAMLSRLECHYLANMEKGLLFALLTDFSDADKKDTELDANIVRLAINGIRKLNQRYARDGSHAPFFLFHRERLWNPSEKKWMGWERKRGKLMEFGKLLLHNAETSFVVKEGDLARLEDFRNAEYKPLIITLDSDTILPRGEAQRLIGTLVHPLNRPVHAASNPGVIVRGYSILQPRVSIQMTEQKCTRYFWVHANNPGIDPYCTAASDVYQDLFAEGSYTGKGIYDLRSFEAAVDGVFRQNQILSHDLIEGCHARVALVSDIQVFDGYPSRYDADAKRSHRWVRGDWQIHPWLFPRVPTHNGYAKNRLSMLARWKIFDNLRRSLYAPSLIGLLVAGWVISPEYYSSVTSIILISLFFPVILQVMMGLIDWYEAHEKLGQFGIYAQKLAKASELAAYSIIFLPHRGTMMADAIVRTLFRMYFSKSRLLEWQTAAAAESQLKDKRWDIVYQLSICVLFGLGIMLLVDRQVLWIAIPFATVWIAAPVIGQYISMPRESKKSVSSLEDANFLLDLISATWGYFEQYVGGSGNWLPPDNVQENVREKIAYRTSPTNEGLFLVSGLVAQRLGLTSIAAWLDQVEHNLDSWLCLDQLHGHHFNWYETRELRPLAPKYVSTVDSGNLLACYLTVANGIEELIKEPIVSSRHVAGALASIRWLRSVADNHERSILSRLTSDTTLKRSINKLADILRETESTLEIPITNVEGIHQFCKRLESTSSLLRNWLASTEASDFHRASDRLQDVLRIVASRYDAIHREVMWLMPWLPNYSALDLSQMSPQSRSAVASAIHAKISLLEIARLPTNMSLQSDLCASRNVSESGVQSPIQEELETGAKHAQGLLERLYLIRNLCEAAAAKMDFRFLYNSRRKLLSIGFNVDSNALDRGHYDLLCSEARLTSFLSIAKGDIEVEHWFRLGRNATQLGGRYTLLSWGGTMFEYLMPSIFQKSFEGSLTNISCHTAIWRQRVYGAENNAPWGISESAFSVIAHNSDYQYKSFGVPGLGLKRGLFKDYVVSPYSSALALIFDSANATQNLRQLASYALGTWGFYDAVDYTKSRMRKQSPFIVVQNYMAHHQGMMILAIANALENGLIQRWFHASPMVRANELLLQERAPDSVIAEMPRVDEIQDTSIRYDQNFVARQIRGFQSAVPRTLLLSNGHFSSLLTHTGGGYCQFNDLRITRWRPDSTRDHWGTFLYLRDKRTDEVWSAAYQPTRIAPDDYEVLLAIDKGEIRRRQGDIETLLEVVVSPEHHAEIRQLKVTNHGRIMKEIEITSYAEIALVSQSADIAHPAFQKLFVETEYLERDKAILASRRIRSKDEPHRIAIHTIALPDDALNTVDYETSRERFIGRNRTTEDPVMLGRNRMSKTVGAVLDPIFSLRCTLQVRPGESIVTGFTIAYAESREQALMLADLYHDFRGVLRAFELAWANAQVELRHLNHSAKDVHVFQQLGGALLYPDRHLRAEAARIAANIRGQCALWRFGISGDYPILLARIGDTNELDFVRELVRAHYFLQSRGIRSDLVISNDYPGTYLDALQEQIQSILNASIVDVNYRRSVFLLRGSQLTIDDHQLLDAVATVYLMGNRGSLARQLNAANVKHRQTTVSSKSNPTTVGLPRRPSKSIPQNHFDQVDEDVADPKSNRLFDNSFGSFGQHAYEIRTSMTFPTPSPWSNILANPRFGCIVTESGGGYTWSGNSRENKITTWSNDPTSDPPSEILYAFDEDSQKQWSPINLLDGETQHIVEHSQGYSRIRVDCNSIQSDTTITVDSVLPVKTIHLKLQNRQDYRRSLKLTYFAETVLGVCRENSMLHQVSGFDDAMRAVTMVNRYHPDYDSQILLLASPGQHEIRWTGDRACFFGRDGSVKNPVGASQPLDCLTGAGLDPCLAMQVDIQLAAGETKEISFILAAASDMVEASNILSRFEDAAVTSRSAQVAKNHWDQMLGAIEVQTPNPALDLMVNRWLPYQTLACRIWGRTAFYQSGGAYGFRDQLQDVMAIVYSQPAIAREHILRAAARQYVEGDVQHWWHPPSGRGTRTRFSDDFLFLPYAVEHYCRLTGDVSILDERIAFIESVPLMPNEQERYEQPHVCDTPESLLQHCCRALKNGMRYGQHGLPLMGCGDWNDGMNRVGDEGSGESVWVAWFQIKLFSSFAKLLEQLNCEAELMQSLQSCVHQLREAIEQHAWDGTWYRRAFCDDGTPLGTHLHDECRIDSIVQSWAVIANGVTSRSRQALHSAVDRLYKRNEKIILLFENPFDSGTLDPGYIRGYLPGVRENGGQYTHAALWMVQAAAILNDGDLAMELFDALNPILHSTNRREALNYRVEPYVVAADVYANPQHVGRGGWTWYTGSAGWMYRIAIEDLLGLRFEQNRLHVRPIVPANWHDFRILLRIGSSTWRILIVIDDDASDKLTDATLALADDGLEHDVTLHCERIKTDQESSAMTPQAPSAETL